VNTIRAHGKVILFGEHAVVFGRPALAIGIPDAMVVREVLETPESIELFIPEWGLRADSSVPGPMGDALRRLYAAVPGRGGCRLQISSTIPLAKGLGSSAALAVVVVKALAAARGVSLDARAVRALAHEAEKVFHGTPSGLDDAVATYGGLCLFRRDPWNQEPVPDLPSRALEPEVVQMLVCTPSFVVADTGVAHRTIEVVRAVRERGDREPEAVKGLFDRMEAALWQGLDAITAADPDRLAFALNRCHEALRELGVSWPQAEQAIRLALESGALAAKMTGAGGGGCVVAFAPGRERDVLENWGRAGLDGFLVPGTGT